MTALLGWVLGLGVTSEVRRPSHTVKPGVQAVTLSPFPLSHQSFPPSACLILWKEVCAWPTPGGLSCPRGICTGGLPLSPPCCRSAISPGPCARVDADFVLWDTRCLTFRTFFCFTVPALPPPRPDGAFRAELSL